jgi:predicted transcriptional regulator
LSEPEQSKREEEEPGDKERNPYLYLGLGLGFAMATVMVIATAGVLAAGLGFVIPATALLGVGIYELQRQRDVLPRPVNKERELLSAIRDNEGRITPTEAAMGSSLTVREADKMLSELAAGGHLMVESKNGALFYSLASRGDPELEGRLEH